MVSSLADTHSFFIAQLKGFLYSKGLNSPIYPIDGILTGTSSLSQSGPGSSANEEVLNIYRISGTGASQSDDLVSFPGHSL